MATENFVTLPQTQAPGQRYPSIDIARGIIMIVMSLDHASQLWNAGRPRPEIAGLGAVDYGGFLQQMTREITHICAPGFQFLAGMGLSISVVRRQIAGKSELLISGDMMLRGIVLLLCDFLLMHYAYDRVPFFFLVLACIGGSTILFAAVRKLPLPVIFVFALLVILGAPLYSKGHIVEPSAWGFLWNALFNVALTESPDNLAFLVLYPVFPWVGCFALGWCVGTMYENPIPGRRLQSLIRGARTRINQLVDLELERVGRANYQSAGELARGPALVAAGMVLFGAAWLLRAYGGTYADQHPLGGGMGSPHFWTLTKYPPSPVFLIATLGLNLTLIGSLRRLDEKARIGPLWRIPLIFGSVSLFYFIIHLHLYGLYPVLSGTAKSYSLGTSYVVWIAGLVLMLPLCVAYRALRIRYRAALRYF